MATCPTCGADVTAPDDVETGEIIDCAACGEELEVVDDDPVALEEAPDLDEDWGE
jgi:alpha-aminoadipate carrier protein LysW